MSQRLENYFLMYHHHDLSSVFHPDFPDGDEGTKETVKYIIKRINEGKIDPHIRDAAIEIVRGCKRKDYYNEIKKLFEFVRDEIRYVKDIYNVETIQRAIRTLETFKAGDCDDLVILLSSMLLSIGHGPVELIIVAADADRQDEFSHIYCQVMHPSRDEFIALDPTVNKPIGWEVPNPYRKMVVSMEEA